MTWPMGPAATELFSFPAEQLHIAPLAEAPREGRRGVGLVVLLLVLLSGFLLIERGRAGRHATYCTVVCAVLCWRMGRWLCGR